MHPEMTPILHVICSSVLRAAGLVREVAILP
jgi:hypothetical protein